MTRRARLIRSLRKLRPSENQLFALLAIAIGLFGGLAAVGFHELIEVVSDGFDEITHALEGTIGDAAVMVPVVVGALLVGPLVFRVASEAKGHGVPEVMEAVQTKGGRIRPRVASVKALASAITIGSGGSAGREGPIVQIGSTLGSLISRPFKMSDRRRSTYVAAGAAAGVAAIFNAPLAGVFFALEVILRSFTARGFSTVVISAVTANAVWRVLVSDDPVLTVEPFKLEHPMELVLYGALGLLAALVALGFVRLLYYVEDRFEALEILGDLKPALGTLVVGGIGVASVDVLGSGIGGIDKALAGNIAIVTVLLLLVGKAIATSFTLGSGGSGGVFSPSLFIGAFLGSAYGSLVHELFPGVAEQQGAYAVVGMAAVFAAAAQAPMASIFMVFEMTNDFDLIMPLMTACAVSTVAYSALKRESIYMEKLIRKRVNFDPERDQNLMETISLTRAAEAKYLAVLASTHPTVVSDQLDWSSEEYVIGVAGDRSLLCVVSRDAIYEAARNGDSSITEIRALADRSMPIAHPSDSLEQGMEMLEDASIDFLPVVDWNERLLGVATRFAIVRAYEQESARALSDGDLRDNP
jgi:CIC family chloride channel protein